MSNLDHLVEQISTKISIADIIGKKIVLKRHGRNFTGLCPFHHEKTPSFSVSPDKGLYYCFGCGASGNLFRFIMESERKTFFEVLEELARLAGLEKELEKLSKKEIVNQDQKKTTEEIYKIHEEAAEFYQKELYSNKGKVALDYLAARKILEAEIKKFKIGYASGESDKLYQFLKSKNYSATAIEKSGLILKEGNKDRFRERIIFPIIDKFNRTIAFGGRTLTDAIPKYLNSPETIIFDKSSNLYGINLLKTNPQELIITEGYVDVIALHKIGFENTLATLGTALSQNHIIISWKYNNEPIICFDGDNAGKRAATRAIDVVLPIISEGKSVKFIMLPQGKDPDDVAREYGGAYFQSLVDNAIPLSEMLWQTKLDEMEPSTPERLANLEKNLFQTSSQIESAKVREYYNSFFNQKLWELKRKNKFTPQVKSTMFHIENTDIYKRIELNILGMIIKNPTLLYDDKIYHDFLAVEFTEELFDNIRARILTALDYSSVDNIGGHLEKEFKKANIIDDIERLFSTNSTFIDIFCSGGDSLNEKWELIFAKYHMIKLEQDYKKFLANFDEESFAKAMIIKNQIEELTNQIKNLEYKIL